jgi:hypothetical protein
MCMIDGGSKIYNSFTNGNKAGIRIRPNTGNGISSKPIRAVHLSKISTNDI